MIELEHKPSEVAVIVERGDKYRLYICTEGCKEIVIEHDIDDNHVEVDDLLQCFDVGDVLISSLLTECSTFLQLRDEGYQVHDINLAEPATNPLRFANIAAELLHETNSDEDGSIVLTELLKVSGKGQWRLAKKANRKMDVRASIMMAYYRKYLSK